MSQNVKVFNLTSKYTDPPGLGIQQLSMKAKVKPNL